MGASVSARVKRCLRAAPGSIPPPSPAPDFERHRRKCAICNHPEREAIEELFIYWHSAYSIQRLFKLPDWSTVYRHAHAAGLYERRRHNIRAVLDHLLEGADGVEATPMSIVAAVRAYTCLTDSGAWLEPAKRVLYTTTYVSNASRQPAAEAVPFAPSDAGGSVPAAPNEVEEESLRNVDSAHASYSERLERRGSASTPPRAASRHGQSAVHMSRAKSHNSPVAPPAAVDTKTSREATAPQISKLESQTSSSPNRQSPELEAPVSHSKQTTAPPSNRQISPHAPTDLPLANSSPGNLTNQ